MSGVTRGRGRGRRIAWGVALLGDVDVELLEGIYVESFEDIARL